MKAYLLLFTPAWGLRDDVQKYLDQLPEVTFWISPFLQGIVMISSSSANALAKKLEAQFGTQYFFIVTEVPPDNSQGRLPDVVWHALNNPLSPRKPRK
jgi:hypothetical protein